jgi:hypothetical protein
MIRSPRRLWNATRLPLLALATAAVAVLAYDVYPRRPPPRSVGELVDRLRERSLCFVVVPASQTDPNVDNGVYLCVRDRSPEELVQLPRLAPRRADWAGVVHAERWPAHELFLGDFAWEAPPCAARVGDVLLFGDPEMLRRIVAALDH